MLYVLVQGAKEVAELLKRNSTLRIVELNNNMIDYSVSSFCSCVVPLYLESITQVYELNLLCLFPFFFFEMEVGIHKSCWSSS